MILLILVLGRLLVVLLLRLLHGDRLLRDLLVNNLLAIKRLLVVGLDHCI